jgi:hypothetical protein
MNTSTASEREGHVEEHEPDADQHRVDRRDRGRSADVAAENIPRAPARAIDRGPHLGTAALQDPGPESRAVAQHEVEHRDSENDAREDPGTRLQAGGGVAGGLAPRVRE